MISELCGEWRLSLSHPPGRLWPILSDTERFNEMSGLPRYELTETPQPDGSVRRVAQGRVARFDIQWEELPVEWVAEQYFFQRRLFLNGPLRRMDASLRLAPEGEGTTAAYHLEIESRHRLIGPYVARRLLNGAGRTFAKAVQGADGFLRQLQPSAFDLGAPLLKPGAEKRVMDIADYLHSGPYDHGLSGRLMKHVLQAPDADACRIRPKALARAWDAPPRHVIELCLAAVRSGMLRLTWDLLCPRCRGAKISAERLDLLRQKAHCPSCNIEFGADFNRNVELVFHPSSMVRECGTGEYCLSGPQTTPHVLIQQSLFPGEDRLIAAGLPPGDYRVRTYARGAELDITVAGERWPEVSVTGDGVVAGGELPKGEIRLVNATESPLTLVIESRAWADAALTAHQVTSLQSFRHLFPEEVLHGGEELAIDSIAILFTDLQGSTALYREIGDGPAYQRVREHFDFLIEIVRTHDGALVKTIGDAVMAVFVSPYQALRAALSVQEKIAEFNRAHGDMEISINMGLHCGRCIVVNLNDRLDYFGSTVNLAARLQGQSREGDIVLSEEIANDPLVAPMLEKLSWTGETMPLKGFPKPVSFRRISGRV